MRSTRVEGWESKPRMMSYYWYNVFPEDEIYDGKGFSLLFSTMKTQRRNWKKDGIWKHSGRDKWVALEVQQYLKLRVHLQLWGKIFFIYVRLGRPSDVRAN